MLNMQKLRMRDLMDMKSHFGKTTVQEVFAMVQDLDEGELTDTALEVVAYLVYLTKRREEPSFTLDDAYDMEFGELNATLLAKDSDPLETSGVSPSTD